MTDIPQMEMVVRREIAGLMPRLAPAVARGAKSFVVSLHDEVLNEQANRERLEAVLAQYTNNTGAAIPAKKAKLDSPAKKKRAYKKRAGKEPISPKEVQK